MPLRKYKITLGKVKDLNKLGEIEKAAGKLFYSAGLKGDYLERTSSLESLTNAQKNKMLWVVKEENKTVVGFAYIRILDNHPHLEEIDIHPAHGRKGLGSALIKTIIKWTKKNNYSMITLSTFSTIPWNAPFYQKIGFVVLNNELLSANLLKLREREKNLGLPTESRCIMCLELTKA